MSDRMQEIYDYIDAHADGLPADLHASPDGTPVVFGEQKSPS